MKFQRSKLLIYEETYWLIERFANTLIQGFIKFWLIN